MTRPAGSRRCSKASFWRGGPLAEARSRVASLPFERADALVVDQIGKNISGDGMDPNITGTHFAPYAYGGPKTENVAVLDLTPESRGSAIGIGAATVTTRRFFDKIDFGQTYPNRLTSKVLAVCKIPLVAPSDRAAIACAIYACALADQGNIRMARIRNSLHADELYVSEALWGEMRENPNATLLQEPAHMAFDADGNLF